MDILLEKLIKAFGTSSHEEGVRNVIFDKLNELDINYEVDKMDNVIVKMGAKVQCEEDKLMFVSHMDTVGLIATVIDDKGFVKVGNLGDFKINNILKEKHKPQVAEIGEAQLQLASDILKEVGVTADSKEVSSQKFYSFYDEEEWFSDPSWWLYKKIMLKLQLICNKLFGKDSKITNLIHNNGNAPSI